MLDKSFIGKKYPPVKYEVGLEKIREYANSTGDHNPLYLDEDAAAVGPYGSIVAPPLFAVVYCKDLVMTHLFDKELALNLMMLVHGEQEFTFHRPVIAGETVSTSGEIVHIENKEKLDVISLKTESEVNGDPVATGVYTFVIRR